MPQRNLLAFYAFFRNRVNSMKMIVRFFGFLMCLFDSVFRFLISRLTFCFSFFPFSSNIKQSAILIYFHRFLQKYNNIIRLVIQHCHHEMMKTSTIRWNGELWSMPNSWFHYHSYDTWTIRKMKRIRYSIAEIVRHCYHRHRLIVPH